MSLYDKLRERYHSQSGMYLNKKTCADLEVFIEELVTQAVKEIADERIKEICKKRAANYMNLKKK